MSGKKIINIHFYSHAVFFFIWFKAGCSTWIRAIGLVSGHITDDRIFAMTRRQSPATFKFNPSAAVHSEEYLRTIGIKRAPWPLPKRMESYYKIAWTRNPYQRLVSAYQDKIAITGNGLRRGSKMVEILRNRRLLAERDGYDKFSFQALVSYLDEFSKGGDHRHILNAHYNTYYSLCRPCEVQYDFIGSTDTLEEDSDFIFKHILYTNLTTDYLLDKKLGPSTSRSQHKSTKDITAQLYNDTSESLRSALRKWLLPDCLLFGYDPDHWT